MKFFTLIAMLFVLDVSVQANTTHPDSKKTEIKKTAPQPKQNSDRVVSGAENPDVSCIDREGKTVTKESPLYNDCLREMKNAK